MVNFQEINEFSSLFLTNLSEPKDNELILELKESEISKTPEEVKIGGKAFTMANRISINQLGIKFNIHFPSYISYHVMDESFLNFNEFDEYQSGKYNTFCIFKKSRYLNFILDETFADSVFPGELKHYGVYCLNHVIHIISASTPIIDIINYRK